MKNLKTLTVGFIAGVACMITTSAIAESIDVTAKLMPDVMFKIDDKVVASPSDQPVLNYKGYSYVPIRFVSDYLGCEVNWDVVNRKIVMKTPEPQVVEKIVEKPVEKIVYVNEDDDPDRKVYSGLPITKRQEDYTLTLIGFSRDKYGNRTDAYITVENNNNEKIQLVQDDCKLIVDGKKEYSLTKRFSLWDDSTWNNEEIYAGEEKNGYLIFDLLPLDAEEFTLQVAMRKMDKGEIKKETVEFNFRKTFSDNDDD